MTDDHSSLSPHTCSFAKTTRRRPASYGSSAHHAHSSFMNGPILDARSLAQLPATVTLHCAVGDDVQIELATKCISKRTLPSRRQRDFLATRRTASLAANGGNLHHCADVNLMTREAKTRMGVAPHGCEERNSCGSAAEEVGVLRLRPSFFRRSCPGNAFGKCKQKVRA